MESKEPYELIRDQMEIIVKAYKEAERLSKEYDVHFDTLISRLGFHYKIDNFLDDDEDE